MDNTKKIRLIQVAKEFKVGFNTLADFLQRKGLQSDCQPSSPVTEEVYAALEKEFGRNRQSGNERNAVRERIQQKGSVSIASQGQKERDDEEEVVVKSNVISVKDEVRGPKILGKIDLDGKKEQVKKEEPKVEAKPVEEPKVEAPKPVVEQVVEPKVEAQKPVEVQKPAVAVDQEVEAKEERRDSVFRPEIAQLGGPKILGTMDVSNMTPGGKHKRKRLEKEKVNVAKEGKNAGKHDKGGQKDNKKGGAPAQQVSSHSRASSHSRRRQRSSRSSSQSLLCVPRYLTRRYQSRLRIPWHVSLPRVQSRRALNIVRRSARRFARE